MVSHPARAFSAAYAAAYAAVSLPALAAYAFLPHVTRCLVFMAVAWGAFGLAVLTLRRSPPGSRAPWWLLTAALLTTNLVGLVRMIPGNPVGTAALSWTDVAGYALFLAAAMTVVAQRGRNDRGGLIEAGIFSAAVGGTLCAVVILPNLPPGQRTGPAQAIIAIMTLLLCGAIGALVRLWYTARSHRRPLGLLMAALGLCLAGQAVLFLSDRTLVVLAQICFMAGYTALGLFGLDPRSRGLAIPDRTPDDHLSHPRLAWLGIAVAAMPACAAIPAVLGKPVNHVVLAACGTAIATLVMARISLLSIQRRQAEEKLRHLAESDPLTGAYNRRGFGDRLRRARAGQTPCILAFCDLDGFKEVNDRYGHAAGDELLVQITERIRERLRPGDAVARIGGDEFLVLFADAPGNALPGVRARLMAAFELPFTITDVTLAVSASVGAVAVGPADLAEFDDLVRLADQLMYQAKTARVLSKS